MRPFRPPSTGTGISYRTCIERKPSKLDRLVFGPARDGRGAEAVEDGSKTVADSTKGLAT